MNFLFRLLISLLVLVNCTWALARTAPPIFELNSGGVHKRIGDIKPSFIVYEDRELPDVDIEYVMRRYVEIFEKSQAPDVKVDALNRINNLQAKYGIDSQKLSIDTLSQSKAVLQSYNAIVDTGIYYDRMDELLYQTAKASTFIGNPQEAIKRLKLLVGLHPRSHLAAESKFRLAEAYFSVGEYQKAEIEYKKLLAHSKTEEFHTQARFKLAWSLFRQERYSESEKNALSLLDAYPELAGQDDYLSVAEESQDLVADTLRLLSIGFSKQEGAKSLEAAQDKESNKAYAYLLYDGLFRRYISQERYQEAAQVASRYASSYLDRENAYLMGLNAIRSYEEGGLDILTWNSKEEFAENFGVKSYYWENASTEQRGDLNPHLVEYTEELAHLYYTRMQKAKKKDPSEHQSFGLRASDYYQQLASLDLPEQSGRGESLFLAAEALRDVGNYGESIEVYQRAGFEAPEHQYGEKAAYASVLTFDQLEAGTGALSSPQKDQKRNNILNYASKYESSKKTPELLNFLANTDFDEKRFESAADIASRVLAINGVQKDVVYSSQLISAHSYYELEQYAKAQGYYELLVANPLAKAERNGLKERLAASIYNQARAEQDSMKSAELYLSLVDAVPDSYAVPNALYDASAQFLNSSAWSQAIASLTHFQERFPKHELYADSNQKLIFAYTQSEDFVSAADKLIEQADSEADRDKGALGYYQAAEYYAQSGLYNEASERYRFFIDKYPEKFDLNVEIFEKVIDIETQFNQSKAQELKAQFVSYEAKNSDKRSQQSAALAAGFSFETAQQKVKEFNESKLSLPLKKSLKRKKTLLKNAVDSLESVAKYGIDEYQSGSTHEIGRLYRSLAQDLLNSERPPTLTELQLEQYDILLEEQAFPFEEQAISLFEINSARAAEGIYDQWVKQSFEVLAEINPIKYLRQSKDTGYAESMH